jgi:hypothetical protein
LSYAGACALVRRREIDTRRESLPMNNNTWDSMSKRGCTVTAGAAGLLGVAIGSAAATCCAFNPPREFSYSYLLILLLCLGPCGGIFGYMFWLTGEPVRGPRLLRITQFIAVPLIIGVLIVFPVFWREMGRRMGPRMVGMFMGFIYATVAFVVTACSGIVHFSHYLAVSLQRATKPKGNSWTDGVWDRDLDQG